MHVKAILTILTAYLTASMALPTMLAERAKKPYVAVALTINIKEPDRPIYFEPSPAELYQLFNFHQLKYVKSIYFDGQHYGVPLNSVECQAYSDAYGTKPIRAFTNEAPLRFFTPTTVGSVVCYAM